MSNSCYTLSDRQQRRLDDRKYLAGKMVPSADDDWERNEDGCSLEEVAETVKEYFHYGCDRYRNADSVSISIARRTAALSFTIAHYRSQRAAQGSRSGNTS